MEQRRGLLAVEVAFLIATVSATVLLARQFRRVRLAHRALPNTGWPTAAASSLLLGAAAGTAQLTGQDDSRQMALILIGVGLALLAWHARRSSAMTAPEPAQPAT